MGRGMEFALLLIHERHGLRTERPGLLKSVSEFFRRQFSSPGVSRDISCRGQLFRLVGSEEQKTREGGIGSRLRTY